MSAICPPVSAQLPSPPTVAVLVTVVLAESRSVTVTVRPASTETVLPETTTSLSSHSKLFALCAQHSKGSTMGIVERLRRRVKKPHGSRRPTSRELEAADLIERLKGYAVHDEECDINQPFKGFEFPPCTCGLTALLKEIEGD